MTGQNRVQWIYSSKDVNELQERYDVWAAEYDSDLDRDFGWYGPQLAAGVLEKYAPPTARILDAGAGTGLVGKVLKEKGYGSIVAMDLSEGMLEIARKTEAYESLDQMTMGETLGYETDSFDAAISVGVFTVGHVPANGLDELVRVVKPGGTSFTRCAPTCTRRTASGRSTRSWRPPQGRRRGGDRAGACAAHRRAGGGAPGLGAAG